MAEQQHKFMDSASVQNSKGYQQLFTAVLLQRSGKPEEAKCPRLRDALAAELLRAGANTASLQAVLSGCAAAVLRLGQALQGPAQQQLVQQALAAMETAPELLIHFERDQQLLQLAQRATSVQQQSLEQQWQWVQECAAATEVLSVASGLVTMQGLAPAEACPGNVRHLQFLGPTC